MAIVVRGAILYLFLAVVVLRAIVYLFLATVVTRATLYLFLATVVACLGHRGIELCLNPSTLFTTAKVIRHLVLSIFLQNVVAVLKGLRTCLLYTSDAADE